MLARDTRARLCSSIHADDRERIKPVAGLFLSLATGYTNQANHFRERARACNTVTKRATKAA
jgi:hypothetical protein